MCDKYCQLYVLRVGERMVSKYALNRSGEAWPFKAWSILVHVYNIQKERSAHQSMDWDSMESDILVPAKDVVLEEITNLRAVADCQTGTDKWRTLKKICHRQMTLLLGKSVRLEVHDLVKGWVPRMEGYLQEFVNHVVMNNKIFDQCDRDAWVRDEWRMLELKGSKDEKKTSETEETCDNVETPSYL